MVDRQSVGSQLLEARPKRHNRPKMNYLDRAKKVLADRRPDWLTEWKRIADLVDGITKADPRLRPTLKAVEAFKARQPAGVRTSSEGSARDAELSGYRGMHWVKGEEDDWRVP
jgi:hypothetical protein